MKLSPLFHDQDLANVTDNACGAVCRMIIARPHAVPLDQVLPVLFRALPLKKDFAENEPVLECLHGLFQAKNAVVVQNLPVLFPVLAQVLADGKQMEVMTKATRAHLESLIKGTAGVADASAMQSMVAGLASELQGAVLPMLR